MGEFVADRIEEGEPGLLEFLDCFGFQNVEDIVDEKKLRLGLVRSLALDVLHDSLHSLKLRIPEVGKAKDLSSIARDMKFVLTEDEANAKTATQVVIYKPIINDISKYETMVVVE